MADSPISGLPETTTVGDDDLILLEQNATAKKVSGRNWKQYFNANVVTASATTVEPTLNPTATYNQYTNNLSLTLPSADYIDTVTKTASVGLVDTYTITSKLGHTATFEVINGEGGAPSDDTPEMDGVAQAGIAFTYSRSDHRHGSDTSKANTGTYTNSQLDSISVTGLYKVSDGNETPNAATVMHINWDNNYAFQIKNVHDSGNVMLFRQKRGGVWSDWITADNRPRIVSNVQLAKDSWTNSQQGYFTQTVTLSATVTSTTKVDVQPNATTLAQMATDGTSSLFIENNNGSLTAYAVGSKPTQPLTIQVMLNEVV